MHSIARILPVLLLASSAALASPIVGRATAVSCTIDGVIYSIQDIKAMENAGPKSYPDGCDRAAFESAMRDCCNKSNGQGKSAELNTNSDPKDGGHVDANAKKPSEDSPLRQTEIDAKESNQPQKVPTTPQGAHILTNAKSGAHEVDTDSNASEGQQGSKQKASGEPILSDLELFASPQRASASNGAKVTESDANAKSNGANPSESNGMPALSDLNFASTSVSSPSDGSDKVIQSNANANAKSNGANPPESNPKAVPAAADANADANPSTLENSKKTVGESASVPTKEKEIAKAESGVPKVDESSAPVRAAADRTESQGQHGSNADAKVDGPNGQASNAQVDTTEPANHPQSSNEKSNLEVGSGAPENVNVLSAAKGTGPDKEQGCTCPL